MSEAFDRWWLASKGDVHKYVVPFVQRCEDELSPIFERIFRLECLYDPNSPEADPSQKDRVTENAIASNVDTISAIVASVDIRARFMTDGGDWEQQRRARHLEWYAEDLQKRFVEPSKKRSRRATVSSRFTTCSASHASSTFWSRMLLFRRTKRAMAERRCSSINGITSMPTS